MACSKFEYVKKFEENTTALQQTYIVVRVDGRAFTKFCSVHDFQKPNDLRAISLMNAAAEFVCTSFKQIFLAYGQSDEFSFAFKKSTSLFSRRTDKILSCVVSAFSSAYVFNWKKFFDFELREIPTFDSRVVTYPNEKCLKDYFHWRQVDCHINNLYNTVFWCLVKTGKSNQQVEQFLKDTNSGQKNEILFKDFGINYNHIDDVCRRGTFFFYKLKQIVEQPQDMLKESQLAQIPSQSQDQKIKDLSKIVKGPKMRRCLERAHMDSLKPQFWQLINL